MGDSPSSEARRDIKADPTIAESPSFVQLTEVGNEGEGQGESQINITTQPKQSQISDRSYI